MTFSDMLAREELLEHAQRSPLRVARHDAMVTQHDVNPLCGDDINVYVDVDHGHPPRVTLMTFTGQGCIVSQAAASLVAEHVVGKTIDESAAIELILIICLLLKSFSCIKIIISSKSCHLRSRCQIPNVVL